MSRRQSRGGRRQRSGPTVLPASDRLQERGTPTGPTCYHPRDGLDGVRVVGERVQDVPAGGVDDGDGLVA